MVGDAVQDVLKWVDSLPFGSLVLVMFCWIFVRAHCIYLLGGATAAGRLGGRLAGHTRRPTMRAAGRLFERVGWPIIPLSFLVAGTLALTQLTAGLLGMPYRRYLPAMLPGAVAWAVLSATIGTLAISMLLKLIDASWQIQLLAVAGVIVLATGAVWVARANRERLLRIAGPDDSAPQTEPVQN